jgi:hypothetical protein
MTALPTQAKATLTVKLLGILRRLVILIVAGTVLGWTLNKAEVALERRNETAGFTYGLAQGALMPIALPNLAMGKDVSIYALNNTGRTYKLGYTMGVNLCGLIFFGFFFWRLRKLKAAARI